MRSPAAAIAWEFRQRHRWGLIALGGYLILLAVLKLIVATSGQRVILESATSFALVVVVPLSATFTYGLAVFTFGHSGDLAARQSIYPARMFTMPATSDALAGWPMLYGTAAMAVLWLATRVLAFWPPGVDVPVLWPALAAASLLAWGQALTWMPYALTGLRVIITILWLAALESITLLALNFKASEPVMLAILAPHVPLAYLVARIAVARARRGDIPDWSGWFGGVRQPAGASRRREDFPSPTRAQLWFEWQRHGRSLPALVGILLPFELALLWLARDAPVLVFTILLIVALTPPFTAAFTAAAVRKSNAPANDYGVTPFIATRPMTSAALVTAKLKMALWSAGAAWMLVLLAAPAALAWSGNWELAADRAQRFAAVVGTPRALVFALLVLAGCIASTWKQLVQSLYVGFSGRAWLVKGSVFVTLTLLTVLGPLLVWIHDTPAARSWLWAASRWILPMLAAAKMAIASWLAIRLYHRRLLSDRALVTIAASWLLVVLAVYGALVWLFATPFVARYLLAVIAILLVPLARLSAAPLAFDWNRHR